MADDTVASFHALTPDLMLDAIESQDIVCDGAFLALNSYENRVYRIGVEDQEPIVAKFYRPERWTDQAIIEEHQFTLELAEQEIPVIPPLLNAKGQSLLIYNDFRFALYPNRGGRAFEMDNTDQLEQLGRFIGRIHALGATQPFQHRPQLSIQGFGYDSKQWLLDNDFIPDYLLESYTTLIDDLLAQIEESFVRAGDIAMIRLHGDCHSSNILYRDKTPHIVDFDDARMGPAIQDLWMFLSGDRQFMQARLGDLLVGYEQFYEFNPNELGLIEALRTLRMIHYAAWLGRRWSDPAFPQAFPWFNTINYWEDHVLSLREQAALMNEPALIW